MELLSDQTWKNVKAPIVVAALLLLLWAVLLCVRPARSEAQSLGVEQPTENARMADYAKPSPFEARKKAPVSRHAVRRVAPVSQPVSSGWNPEEALPVRFEPALPDAR